MANPFRGEVCYEYQEQKLIFALTLNSLAMIEEQLEGHSFLSLFQRLSAGQFSAKDITLILETSLKNKEMSIETRSLISLIPPDDALMIVCDLIKRSFSHSHASQEDDNSIENNKKKTASMSKIYI